MNIIKKTKKNMLYRFLNELCNSLQGAVGDPSHLSNIRIFTISIGVASDLT